MLVGPLLDTTHALDITSRKQGKTSDFPDLVLLDMIGALAIGASVSWLLFSAS